MSALDFHALFAGENYMLRFRTSCLMLAVICFIPQALVCRSRDFHFTLKNGGEAVAELRTSAPGASWATGGNEAAVARITLDGQYNQDVTVFGNERPATYRVLLGYLKGGPHTLAVERDDRLSARQARLEVDQASVSVISDESPEFRVVQHAPVLFGRADTLGAFTDAPLLMWYEIFKEPEGETIQYSIVFSNEDGGTRTDALMARWGRATDIEYIYRVTLDNHDRIEKEMFLGIDEKPHPFRGRKEGLHPLILDATPNNDFTDTGFTPVRYRFMPVYADLTHHSREELMNRFPWTYRVMSEELSREGKLRPFGTSEGTKVSDPRNYMYLEMKAENNGAGLIAWAKLKNGDRWYSSNKGRFGLVIHRNGWFRTTIELPPGTSADSIQYLALECVDMLPLDLLMGDQGGETVHQSVLESVSRAFLLDSQYHPGKNLFEVDSPVTLRPGQMVTFRPVDSKPSGGDR
jgi:hypothetical protein